MWQMRRRGEYTWGGGEGLDWIYLAVDRKKLAGYCEHGNEPSASIKRGELLGLAMELSAFQDALFSMGQLCHTTASFIRRNFQNDTQRARSYNMIRGAQIADVRSPGRIYFCMVMKYLWTLSTVQFLYLETFRVMKWGKTNERDGTGYEASIRVTATDVSENCQSQRHRPKEHLKAGTVTLK